MSERKITDLLLERHLCGDLSPEELRVFERDATEGDRAELARLRSEGEAYVASMGAHKQAVAIAHQMQPRRTSMKFFGPLVLAACAAAGLFLIMRPSAEDKIVPDVMTKGSALRMKVHVATASGSRLLASGDSLPAHSQVRFELIHESVGFAAVIGIDSAQVISVYYPGDRMAAPYLPAQGALPGAIELDDTLGDETFYGLFSHKTFDAQVVGARLLSDQSVSPDIEVTQLTVAKTATN